MKRLFKNARILTMHEGEEIFFGNLLVDGSRISYVGPEMPAGEFDEVIECDGDLLMPGFKNAHSHSAMSFTRSIADDLPLHEWLFDKIFPLEAKLQPLDIYRLSKVSILEYLTSGITSCFDMYLNDDEMVFASNEMGYRSVVLGTFTSDPKSIDAMKAKYLKYNQPDSLVSYKLGFHAEYTSKEELLKKLSDLSHELKAPIYTHISETLNEVRECEEKHNGMSPVEYCESLGLWDYGGAGFHCVWFTPKDLEIWKKHGLGIVTNPGSNSKLASGVAPLELYCKEGLTLGIGTDGAGSNNGLDMFYEMRLACVMQKLQSGDAASFDALLALKAATVGGAKIMGLDDCLYLEKGMKADIIRIDLKRPSMQPLNNIAKNLVYSGSKDVVKMTMVNGKILYQDGEFHVGQSILDIYDEAQKVTDRLKA